jgi:hypothetical protein
MFEPINSSGLGTEIACRWCDKTLTQAEVRVSGHVCKRCVRMLLDAGVTEEEILDSAESYSGKKRSAGAKSTGPRINRDIASEFRNELIPCDWSPVRST